MPQVTFTHDGESQTVEGKEGKTLLQTALDNNIPMENACGGNGFCTTCLCKVKKGAGSLSERSEREEGMGIINDPERLGCQAKLGNEDVEVEMIE